MWSLKCDRLVQFLSVKTLTQLFNWPPPVLVSLSVNDPGQRRGLVSINREPKPQQLASFLQEFREDEWELLVTLIIIYQTLHTQFCFNSDFSKIKSFLNQQSFLKIFPPTLLLAMSDTDLWVWIVSSWSRHQSSSSSVSKDIRKDVSSKDKQEKTTFIICYFMIYSPPTATGWWLEELWILFCPGDCCWTLWFVGWNTGAAALLLTVWLIVVLVFLRDLDNSGCNSKISSACFNRKKIMGIINLLYNL